jgi:hypothetical protein
MKLGLLLAVLVLGFGVRAEETQTTKTPSRSPQSVVPAPKASEITAKATPTPESDDEMFKELQTAFDKDEVPDNN